MRDLRIAVVVAIVLGAVVLAGCGPVVPMGSGGLSGGTVATAPVPAAATTAAAPPPATPKPAPNPTPKPTTVAINTRGTAHTPAYGSAERTQLMDAARKRLQVSEKFEVLDLVSDNAWAAGILRGSSSGREYYVAWRCEVPGGWKCFWNGSSGSGAIGAIQNADKRFPYDLGDRISWTGPLKPSESEVIAAVKRIAGDNGAIPIKSVRNIKMKVIDGSWCASAIAVPTSSSYDSLVVYIYKDPVWYLYDMGTGITKTDLDPAWRSLYQ